MFSIYVFVASCQWKDLISFLSHTYVRSGIAANNVHTIRQSPRNQTRLLYHADVNLEWILEGTVLESYLTNEPLTNIAFQSAKNHYKPKFVISPETFRYAPPKERLE
jgi:hypothetical protein